MGKKDAPIGSGQQLLADFQTALVSRSTIAAAKYEANRSEEALIQELSSVSPYLNPSNLGADVQKNLTRESLDAHIKKVQAQQLDSMSGQQLAELQQTAQDTYRNRKIQITVLPGNTGVIESIWFDQRNGYRNGIVTKKLITGIIDEVALDKNTLVLKPTRTMQLLNGRLQNYLVYVIDPKTLMPLVQFTLI